MDGSDDYIWRRRIHHGVRHQKCAIPFPESVEIGLEFNAALERKEKLDPCLLTNAVMLELCDFAKTVTKSETYFLFEMLEFNFDLGVDTDNDMQCYEYGRRVHNKIKLLKEQIKFKPRRWKEPFLLPDRNAVMEYVGSEQSGRYYPKRNKIVDSSVLTDGSKNSQSSGSQKKEASGAVSSACITKKPGGVRSKPTGDAYPCCKELGVTLTVGSGDTKQKLDPDLLTNGVMMELLYFSRVLCGTQTGIVHDLVKQNFGHELDKMQFRMQVSKLLERKYACVRAEDRDAFRKEPFKVQTKKQQQNHKKRKSLDTNYQELEKLTLASKRRGTLRHRNIDAREIWQDSDLSYTCPVDFETEMQSDTEVKPQKMKLESCSSGTSAETKSAASLDIKHEEEEVVVSPVWPQTNGHSSSSVNLHPKTQKEVADMFFEHKNEDINVKTLKQKLWMRRAVRSKQILKSSKVNDLFAHCRRICLDFNIGSGNKQSVDLQLLTNCVLWEVYRFAATMSKSFRSFFFDILDNNFKLVLQDELHQRNFIYYMITKEKVLQNHPARQEMEFLSSPFQFPEVYNMADVTSDFQSGQDAKTEQPTKWDSPAQASDQQADMELHPFCHKLGLNLWSTQRRPANRKLDLTALTTGAVLEIFSFVRELCGTLRESVNDILEHNFDLELQSGVTKAAQVIQRWYTTQKSFMKRQNASPKINKWLNMVVPLNGRPPLRPQLRPQPPPDTQLEDLCPEDSKLDIEMQPFSGNVRQVKRANDYHTCKQIGLDLDVCSKSEAKTKLDLQVLTRGVLLEVHQYVVQNCQQYVPALYAILEYNFDLSLQDHRKVEFACSIASQVIAMAGKKGRKGGYLNKVFELPFEASESSQIVCKEEPEDGLSELHLNDNLDVMFVRELKPVDIEVEIE